MKRRCSLAHCEKLLYVFFFAVLYLVKTQYAAAQSESLLADVNGDGVVRIAAFGDSITYGVGDGTSPGQVIEEAPRTTGASGYCARLELASGVLVDNLGSPGEELRIDGVARIPDLLSNSPYDIVVIFEGTNDALHKTEASEFQVDYQRVINVAKFLGKIPISVTLPPTCCNRAGRAPFLDALNASILHLKAINSLHLADVNHAFETTCDDYEECNLLNIPEGLHPNSLGYDVISQVILAAVSGIDIFAADGAQQLEAAYALPAGTIVVKPDPVAAN